MIDPKIGKVEQALLGMAPTRDDSSRFLHGVASATFAKWKALAMQRLKTTARDYVAGLSLDVKESSATISLEGELPNLVEQGFAGGDMRTYMLTGKHVKMSKDGKRYLIIPFRHGTPGTGGRNVGPEMPQSIYTMAKMLRPTIERPSGTKWGGKLRADGKGASAEAKTLLTSKAKPWHASSLYTDMVRKEKTYASAKQGSYSTFRVISENVVRGKRDSRGRATQHWFHPGIRPANLVFEAQKFCVSIAGELLSTSIMSENKQQR